MDVSAIPLPIIPLPVSFFSYGLGHIGKRNEDGVRVLKIEREKKFSCAELLSRDRAGLMGVELNPLRG